MMRRTSQGATTLSPKCSMGAAQEEVGTVRAPQQAAVTRVERPSPCACVDALEGGTVPLEELVAFLGSEEQRGISPGAEA